MVSVEAFCPLIDIKHDQENPPRHEGLCWDSMVFIMSSLGPILNTILPVFITAGIGFIISRFALPRIVRASRDRSPTLDADVGDSTAPVEEGIRKFLHSLTFNFAGPPYILAALWTSTVTLSDLGTPAVVSTILYLVMVLVAYAVGGLGRWSPDETKAAALSLASTNCGNYGLPVLLLAFGEDGLVLGAVFVVAHVLAHLTVGLGIASWNKDRSFSRQLVHLLKYPYIYAIGLGLLLRSFDIEPPLAVSRSLDLIGSLWIPLMLLLLGMELERVRIALVWKKAAVLSAIKLLAPPLIAWGITTLLGISGWVQAVLVVECSMPTAVNGLLLARQCNTRPDLVASTLLLSTLGSIFTLSALLVILA